MSDVIHFDTQNHWNLCLSKVEVSRAAVSFSEVWRCGRKWSYFTGMFNLCPSAWAVLKISCSPLRFFFAIYCCRSFVSCWFTCATQKCTSNLEWSLRGASCCMAPPAVEKPCWPRLWLGWVLRRRALSKIHKLQWQYVELVGNKTLNWTRQDKNVFTVHYGRSEWTVLVNIPPVTVLSYSSLKPTSEWAESS